MNVQRPPCQVSVIIDIFLSKFNLLERFFKNTEISNFMKIRPVGARLFHADGRTDRQTGKTKLTVPFSNFSKAPKTQLKITIKAKS